ncbi:hypothetical protein SLA2020_082520 [Shorea laevis]
MELCASQAVLNLPPNGHHHHHHRTYRFLAAIPTPASKPSLSFNQAPISRTTYRGVFHRVVTSTNLLPRARTSEETSTETNKFTVEDDASEENGYSDFFLNGGPKSGSLSDVQTLINELLDKLNIKLDSEDAYPILLYGSGTLVALWLASAVVGAIDSIPLFPKLMEVVGLGYTIWFSSRYLLFKKNRDELAAKIEELKQQIQAKLGEEMKERK